MCLMDCNPASSTVAVSVPNVFPPASFAVAVNMVVEVSGGVAMLPPEVGETGLPLFIRTGLLLASAPTMVTELAWGALQVRVLVWPGATEVGLAVKVTAPTGTVSCCVTVVPSPPVAVAV